MAMVMESIEIIASPKKCYEVIMNFERYPEFLSDLKNVTVKNKKGETADVTYEIEVIKRIQYTLKLKGKPHSRIEWSFIKGDIMKDNQGAWDLEEIKKGVTRATYSIEVKFGLLVPGAITKTLVSKNLPAMLKSFKQRIENQ